jgi:hypothetical protein
MTHSSSETTSQSSNSSSFQFNTKLGYLVSLLAVVCIIAVATMQQPQYLNKSTRMLTSHNGDI